jgi:hypothetical protein
MNEFVVLEIKGGRFLKAEELLSLELNSNPNYETYFTLMFCKINLMFDENRTMDEVIYCSKKSLELVDNDKKEELLSSTKEVVVNILKQLSVLNRELSKQLIKEKGKKFLGNIVSLGSIISMTVSETSSSQTSSLSTIGQVTALGTGVSMSLDGLNKIKDIKLIKQKSIELGKGLIYEFTNLGLDEKELSTFFDEYKFIPFKAPEIKIPKIKDLSELQETYSINDEDFVRMSQLANSIQAISFKNFKKNEGLKKELEELTKKYNVSVMKKGDLVSKLKKNPIH